VAAIEGAAGRLAPNDLAGALNGVFDAAERRIAAFDRAELAASSPHAAEMPAAQVSEAAPAVATMVEEIIDETESFASEPVTVEEPSVIEPLAVEAAVIAEVVSEPVDAFNADDEAVLDRIAMEMAAPDIEAAYEPKPVEGFDSEEFGDIEVTFTTKAEARTEAKTEAVRDEPVAATVPPVVTPIEPEPVAVRETASEAVPSPEAEIEPSLGSSLLANGIVSRRSASRPDPFAPIRRMSQTEKIAFFS